MGKKINLILFFMVFFCGCGTANVSRDFVIKDSKDKGIVIGSITQNKGVPGGVNAKIYYGKLDGNNEIVDTAWINARPENYVTGTLGFKSEFEGLDGRLFVIELPEGDHALFNWSIDLGNAFINPVAQPPSQLFYVEPGRVTYIGNIHMHYKVHKSLIGLKAVGSGVPEITNQHDRDLSKFKELYPNLFSKEILHEPMYPGIWMTSPELKTEHSPIYIPVE